MASAGEVWVDITARDRGLRAGLSRAEGQVSRSAGIMQKSLSNVTVGNILSGVAVQRAASFLTTATMEAAKSQGELQAALQNTGMGGRLKELQDYAQAIQTVTVHDDEAVQGAMTLGLNMGIQGDQIKNVTKAAVGLAAMTGRDLPTAMNLLVRAANGNTAMLSRYGIKIRETGTDQEKFADLVQQGASKFQLATLQTNNAAAKITQLKNAVGDVAERIGNVLLPVIVKGTALLTVFARWLNNGGAAIVETAAKVALAVGAFALLYQALSGIVSMIKVIRALSPAQWAVVGVAAVAIGTAWGLAEDKVKDAAAGIKAETAALWNSIGTASKQGAQDMGDATDEMKAAINKDSALLKPLEQKTDKLDEEAKAISDIVKQNREAQKAETDRRRASIGWTGIGEMWKKAMVAGAAERFGATGIGIYQTSRQAISQSAGRDYAGFVSSSEIARAQASRTDTELEQTGLLRAILGQLQRQTAIEQTLPAEVLL